MNKSKLRNLLCITMLFLICSVILKAQTPKFINYQGLARDASGNPITNQSVALGFTITNGSSAPFTDSKNATTNTFGLFNTTIGSSSNPINSNLSFGSYSLIVSINSSVLPPQLLASVPYALNAPEPTVTYTSGVLSIGSSTVAINSASYQAGNGISISSGSIINTAPSQTININTTNTVLTVNSAYPSYSINMASQVFSASTNTIISSYGGSFVIPTSTSSILNGDVTGPSNSNTVIALRNISLAVTPPTSGQRLTYNGSTWNYVTPPFSISGNTITPSNLAHGLAIGTNSLTFGGNNYSLAVTGAQYLDGFFNQNGMLPPSLSGTGNGRIYFNSLLNKFMVSEGGNSYVPLLPTNIWTITGTAIYPTTLTNNVGLGTNSPTSKLEVVETNSTIATKISSSGAAHALEVTNSNSNNVYYAGNFKGGVNIISKSGPTDYGLLVRDNLLNSVFNVQNNGNVGVNVPAPNAKIHVIENTTTGQAAGLFQNTYTTTSVASFGIRASSSNSNSTSAGVYAESLGGGNGVSGISTSTTFTGTAGVYGLALGSNSTNVSIQADANFGNSTGLLVNSFGAHSGIGLHVKRSGTGSGIGARVENIVVGNTADAIFALTEGTGAAVHAVSSLTNSASALSLLLENGHISTRGTSPTIITPSLSPGGATTLLSTSTDVAGRISITFGTGPFTAGNYANIQFVKNYSIAPIVILTPANSIAANQTVWVSSSISGFQINYSGGNAITPGSTHSYNYYIIETK